jgi:hypothetical protein
MHRDAIIAAGWPRERVTAQAAKNRLFAAISMLRKLGLPVVTIGDGYALDATVALRIEGA